MRKTVKDGWRIVMPSGMVGSAYYRDKKSLVKDIQTIPWMRGFMPGLVTVTYDDGRPAPKRRKRRVKS